MKVNHEIGQDLSSTTVRPQPKTCFVQSSPLRDVKLECFYPIKLVLKNGMFCILNFALQEAKKFIF